MKLNARVKLLPSAKQEGLLVETIKQANDACNEISKCAWETETFGQYRLQGLVYQDIREQTGLSAQMVIRCIAKVADSYKIDGSTLKVFRPMGSISYDDRILTWRLDNRDEASVSIWTVKGRQQIPFACRDRHWRLLPNHLGETDLVYHSGGYYLFATCYVENPEPEDFWGIPGYEEEMDE
jgi:predicted transposase